MAAAARRMFEQQAQDDASSTKSPASSSSQRKPGVAPTNKKKCKPTAANANTIIAWMQYLQGCRETQKKVDNKQALVIQAEFRDYLRRTHNVRQLRRRRRREQAERFRRLTDHLVQQLRTNGRAICGEEATNFMKIVRFAYAERGDVIQREELRGRYAIEDEFVRTVNDAYTNHAADELKPTSVPGQEFRCRQHIEQFQRFSISALFQQYLSGISVAYLTEQQDARLRIIAEEVEDRFSIVGQSRAEFLNVRLQEEQHIELQLRGMFEEQRDVHFRSMTMRRASIALDILSGPELQCEGGSRVAIEEKEAHAFRLLHRDFCEMWTLLACSELLRDEMRIRVGAGGIIAQEQKQWQQIHSTLLALKLQKLQRDEEDSVHCESGARSAIAWEETRVRYNIQQSRTSTMFTMFLPIEEASARRRLETNEFMAYRRILASPQLLDVMEKVMEPASRRALYSQWCQGARGHLFVYSRVGVQGVECKTRTYLRLMEEVQFEFLQSLEYLYFLELKERDVLHGVVRRVWERMRRSMAVQPRPASSTRSQSLKSSVARGGVALGPDASNPAGSPLHFDNSQWSPSPTRDNVALLPLQRDPLSSSPTTFSRQYSPAMAAMMSKANITAQEEINNQKTHPQREGSFGVPSTASPHQRHHNAHAHDNSVSPTAGFGPRNTASPARGW